MIGLLLGWETSWAGSLLYWTWASHKCPTSFSSCKSSSTDLIIRELSKTEQATLASSVPVMPSTVGGPFSLGWVGQVAVAGYCKRHTTHSWRHHTKSPAPHWGAEKANLHVSVQLQNRQHVPANQWRGALSPHTWGPFLYPDHSTAHPCRKPPLHSSA